MKKIIIKIIKKFKYKFMSETFKINMEPILRDDDPKVIIIKINYQNYDKNGIERKFN